MTREDVIHDFSIPAFRIKHDVLPGRYDTLWFTATTPGTYHLFCTQFCGTDHSVMGGEVVVLTGPDFQQWLDRATAPAAPGRAGPGAVHPATAAAAATWPAGPATARRAAAPVRAPPLNGVYGHPVPLADGTHGHRRRPVHPRQHPACRRKQIVAGYENRMPSFAGVVTRGGPRAAHRLHQVAGRGESRSLPAPATGARP